MKPQDLWLQRQLKEIEKLQKAIYAQQGRAEDNLKTLKRESLLILDMLKILKDLIDLDSGENENISPELEKAVNLVGSLARAIDRQVPDQP